VEAGVVEPPIKDGSSVVRRVEFQLLSRVAQFGQWVRIVGHQQEQAGTKSGPCCLPSYFDLK
jgi:hypothetical protein